MPDLSHLPSVQARSKKRELGAASLIVVMVLFFVVSMVAAYANRSLLFEQRTSANQHRSTRALEAAEAGVEWALSMLNSGRTTATCLISGDTTDTTFRQRYLVVDPETGDIVPKKRSDNVTSLYPTCASVGGVWTCNCPTDADPTLPPAPGADSFRVRFRRVCAVTTSPDTACTTPVQPGVIHIDVNGCTTLDDDCLRFNDEANPGKPLGSEGRATVHVVAGLIGALPSHPGAALTARTTINVGAAPLKIINSDAVPTAAPNITAHSGGALTATAVELYGAPGVPATRTLRNNDTVLAALSADRMFVNTFGMSRLTYVDQPGVVVVDCGGGCNATTVRDRAQMNPGRILWLDGDVDLDTAVSIGTSDEPVVLNVTGSLTFGSAATVNGLVYSQAATWTMNGSGQIVGAAVAENAFAGTPNGALTYSSPTLTRLRTSTGTFVKVPGSWKDFEQ